MQPPTPIVLIESAVTHYPSKHRFKILLSARPTLDIVCKASRSSSDRSLLRRAIGLALTNRALLFKDSGDGDAANWMLLHRRRGADPFPHCDLLAVDTNTHTHTHTQEISASGDSFQCQCKGTYEALRQRMRESSLITATTLGQTTRFSQARSGELAGSASRRSSRSCSLG